MQESDHIRPRSMTFGLCIGLLVSISQLHADDAANEDRASILAVLKLQTKAWNDGDIDRFMKHYWDSDQLTFSSGGHTLRGWKETEQRDKTRYVTPEKMGRLSFDKLEIQPLGRSAAYVLGEWRLERKAGDLSGNFTLIFRRINGHWLIVHDHTSLLQNDS